MSMTFGEALDQIRGFHTKWVKPFAQLEAVMAVALEVESALPDRQRQLAELTAAIAKTQGRWTVLEERVAAAERATEAAEAASRARHAEADAAEAGAAARLEAIAAHEATRARALADDTARQQGAVEQAQAERREVLAAEITALEKKKAALGAAVAALRQKFAD